LLFIRPEKPFCKGLPDKGKNRRGSINLGKQCGVRKRETLEKDSSLGLKRINILYINLGRLVSGRSYTIPYTLFYNRYQVLTSALANSIANAFALIDT